MKVITEAERRRTVAKRWADFYGPLCRAQGTNEPFLQELQGEQLKALGENPALEQIAEVIGKDMAGGWAGLMCSECERKVSAVVELSSAQDYDTSAEVCADCLREALRLLGEYPPSEKPCRRSHD